MVLKITGYLNGNIVEITNELNKFQLSGIYIPKIEVEVLEEKTAFKVYSIKTTDPIYKKIQYEDDESMSDACRLSKFFIKNDRPIDINLLIKALKAKVKGNLRRYKKFEIKEESQVIPA